jgi:type IX secretion system PorP/SprF family membrane protein
MIFSLKDIKTTPKLLRLIFITGILASLLPEISVKAQDIHFSQFYTTPILTNPANTGMSDENLRFANNYRNQWAKIGVPYKTLYTSLDSKISIAGQSFGIGGLIVHDQTSVYNLSSNEFLISLSYTKFINNQQFTFGIQPGFAIKSYSPGGLTFGTQFESSSQQYNPNLPSSEYGLTGNLHYFDMNVGIFWRTLIRNIMPSAGFAISHVFSPIVTFSTSTKNTRLPLKLTFNSQVLIPLNDKVDITPSLLYSSVPGASELLIGSIEGYSLNNISTPVKKIYAITMFRINPFSNIDAMIFGGGVKFSKFDLGISYDFNVSPLSKASYFNGAFEVSLIFTAGNAKKNVNEPCYIY